MVKEGETESRGDKVEKPSKDGYGSTVRVFKEEETESCAEKIEKPFRTNLCLKKLEISQGTFQVSFIFRYIKAIRTFNFKNEISAFTRP